MKLDIVFLFFLLLLCIILSISLKTGTIYKVQCQKTAKVYIGRTTIEIERAIQNIINSFDSYKRGTRKYALGPFKVIANKDYNVTILEELYKLANDTDFSLTLRKRQRFYLEQNANTVNKNKPSRPIKVCMQEYYQLNKEAHSLSMKKYYQRVKPLRTKTIICDICGGEHINGSSWDHIRSKRHLTALAKLSSAIAPSPQHQQQTLDNLLNSVMQTCDVCGVECTKKAFLQHTKSKRHLTALAKLNSEAEPGSGLRFQQKLSDLLNSRKMTCEICSGGYTKGSLYMHKKSKRHLTALAKLNQGLPPSLLVP